MSPKTWFAGKSYPVTITGTGFTTSANATASCPVTPVAAKVASGSSASLTNVTVVSPTQITFTVEPGASDPTGNAAITVGSSSNGGAVSVRTQILGNQIQWNGKTISTADGSAPPAQDAVVGEQIALTTTTPATTAYDGSPVSQVWTVSGTRIANYAPTTASASVTKLLDADLQKSNVTFYWVYPESPIPVTYQYCVNIKGANPILQCSLPANAAFDLNGVTSPSITFTNEFLVNVYNLDACNGQAGGSYLVYGNVSGPHAPCTGVGKPGLQFFPQGTQPGNGNLFFVQIVNKDRIDEIGGTSNQSCTTSIGVDGQYPYQGQLNPTSVVDAPEWGLSAAYPIVTRNFNASMYLFWQSTATSNSIPIPLGYLPWGFDGSAQLAGGTWSGSGAGAPIGSDGTGGNPFVQTQTLTDIPIWGGPAETECTQN
jgi:hypothetical protein